MNLSPWVRSQFFNDDGSPLAGGQIDFLVAGSTSQRKDTYRDYLGSVLNTNPVILNSAGVASIWGSGLYDVVISDSNGALVETIRGVNFGGGSSNIGTFAVVANYNALRNLTEDYDAVIMLGRDLLDDGGEGLFIKSPSTEADDDGVILVRANSTRYVRVLDDLIKAEWFGVKYGTSIDNSTAFNSAVNSSIYFDLPLAISGSTYFASNIAIKSGAKLIITGSLTGVSGITITFKNGSKLLSASQDAFSSSINVRFESGVADGLRVSWFANGVQQAIETTVENYDLLIDEDTTVSQDLTVPLNLAVDFIGGSKFIVTSASDLVINTLKYSDAGQIIVYKSKSYIKNVKLGSSYAMLEWFGGAASTELNTLNEIPFTAALVHGQIYLVSTPGTFYNIPAGTYSTSNGLVLLGNYLPNSSNVNDSVPSTLRLANGVTLTTGKLSLSGVKIIEQGSIVATETSIVNSIVAKTNFTSSKMSKVNDLLATNPNFVTVGVYGRIGRTNNVNGAWTPVTTSFSVNFTSVTKGKTLFVAVGQNGTIATSPDGNTWTQQASNISTNLNCVKWIEATGKFIAVGDAGKLLYSANGVDWNLQITPIFSIKSVTYFNGLYVIVGENGKIYTSADLLSWSLKVATGVTGILYSVDASSTLLTIVGVNGTIITSSNGSSYQVRIGPSTSTLYSVKFYSGSNLWVATGGAGTVLKSSDGLTYSTVKTLVDNTDVIYDQVQANGEWVFVSGSGKIMTSYDMTSFSLSTPMSAQDFYGIASAPAKVLAVGDGGQLSETVDGVNFTLQESSITYDLNRIKLIGNYYVICGDGGKYLYSLDGENWSESSVSTHDLFDVVGNSDTSLVTMVGDSGLVATSANPFTATPTWVVENIYVTGTTPLTDKIVDIVYNPAIVNKYTLTGDNGICYVSPDSHTWSQTSRSVGDKVRRVIFDGSKYYQVSVNSSNDGYVSVSTDGTSYSLKVTNYNDFTRVAKIGSNAVLFGFAGNSMIQYSSDDFTTWTFDDLNFNDYTITAIVKALVNGNEIVLFATSTGEILIGNVVNGTISATKVTVTNSIVDLQIANTVGGDIADAQLLDILKSRKLVGSTVSRMTGAVSDLISRTDISFMETVGIDANCFIGDSQFENVSSNSYLTVLKAGSGVTDISVNNSIFNTPNGMIVYSENTALKVSLNGGIIYNGSVKALSNGYAKVFTNGTFDENANLIENVSAYSINNIVLEDELVDLDIITENITSSKDHWHGSDLSQFDLATDHFVTNSDVYLASNITANGTLRYRFGSTLMRLMKSYGGRIKTTIQYPANADKENQSKLALETVMFIPSYIVRFFDYNELKYGNGMNERWQSGRQVPVNTNIDSAKFISYTNVWCGREDLIQQQKSAGGGIWHDAYSKNEIFDEYVDYKFAPVTSDLPWTPETWGSYQMGHDVGFGFFSADNFGEYHRDGDLTFEAYIVLKNKNSTVAYIPAGTTIKIELLPSIPKSMEAFNAFYPAPDYGVDAYNGRENQFLHFAGFDGKTLKCTFDSQTTSQTHTLNLYKNTALVYTQTPPSGASAPFSTMFKPEQKLETINFNVEIKLNNLEWTISAADTKVLTGHYRVWNNFEYYSKNDYYSP